MSFVVSDRDEVFWPAVIPKPADGGKIVRHKIQLRFVVLEQPDLDKYIDMGRGGQIEALREAVTGWKGVERAKDDPLPFSDEVFEKLLRKPYFRQAAWEALIECVVGAAPKN